MQNTMVSMNREFQALVKGLKTEVRYCFSRWSNTSGSISGAVRHTLLHRCLSRWNTTTAVVRKPWKRCLSA